MALAASIFLGITKEIPKSQSSDVMAVTAAAEDILQSLRAGHGPEGLMVSPFY